MKTYNVTDIIKELMIEIGEVNTNNYVRYLQVAYSGLRELQMDVSGSPKVALLQVNSINTAPLPSDFINYLRIGVCDQLGNISDLGLNDSICFNHSFDKCGNPSVNAPSQVPALQGFITMYPGYADNWRNGEMMGRFFGVGGGNNWNGNYRFDYQNNVIQFNNLPFGTTEVVLEYVADVSKIDGQYQVHPFIVECLKNWIAWKSISRNANKGLGERELAEREYWRSYRQAKKRFTSRNLQEWLEAFRAANKASPKF